MLNKQGKLTILAIAIILLVFGGLQTLHAFLPFENALTEARFSISKRKPTGDVVFIAVDKRSLDDIGQWPWPRRVHAKIIDKLIDEKAAEISFDIDFSTPSNKEDDRLLAEALERAEGAVILAAFGQAESVDADNLELVTSKPIAQLLENAWSASVNVLADEDGVVRRIPVGQTIGDDFLPSLSALLSGKSASGADSVGVDFSIDAFSIPIYSVYALLNDRVPANALAGKKIIIGASAIELRDTLAVPVYGILPGSLVQALGAETLLQERGIQSSTLNLTLFALTLVLLLTALICSKQKLAPRLIICGSVIVGVEIAAIALQYFYPISFSTVVIHGAVFVYAAFKVATELYYRKMRFAVSDLENRDLKRIFSQVITDNFDAILVFGDDGSVVFESEVAREIFAENGESSLIDVQASDILPLEISGELADLFKHMSDQNELTPISGETSIWRSDGHRVHLEYILTPSRMEDSSFSKRIRRKYSSAICFTARDITAERMQRKQLEYMARFDPLTGASNRMDLAEEIKKRVQYDEDDALKLTSSSLFAFDLNGMGVITGTFGLKFGDQILIQVVQRARSFAGDASVVSRLGDDRFIVYTEEVHREREGEEFAVALRQVLEEPYTVDHHTAFVRASVGVAFSWQGHEGPGDYLRAAEIALAAAHKETGKHVSLFDENESARVQRALKIERALWQALDRDEFELLFQPQVDLSDDSFVGAEALVRWHSRTLGKIFPDEFITIAESNGAIRLLGKWILDKACTVASSWPEHTSISINVSAIQLESGDFIADIKDALNKSGLDPKRLVIELTESVLVDDRDGCLEQMRKIREMGARIAMDDFGTGYSSLQYLTQLPIDKLKIDRAFVLDLDRTDTAVAIINAIVSMSNTIGFLTCCEGIETREQADLLRSAGCDIAQGYFYGKPMSQGDFEAALGMEPAESESLEALVAG